jgi:hypothetical protein
LVLRYDPVPGEADQEVSATIREGNADVV